MGQLDRDIGVSADGLGEGCSEEIGTVNEFWVVTDTGNAVIVGSPPVLVRGVLGDNGGIASDGEGGVIGKISGLFGWKLPIGGSDA